LQDAYVSGFTAKYHAPYRKRDATLVFHGAEENDLDKAEEAFDATPSRIEWDQTNSPLLRSREQTLTTATYLSKMSEKAPKQKRSTLSSVPHKASSAAVSAA